LLVVRAAASTRKGQGHDLASRDPDRLFAAIIRPDGKLVWRQVKLPPGVKTDGLIFDKIPSDFRAAAS
jgi:hypothetical protein